MVKKIFTVVMDSKSLSLLVVAFVLMAVAFTTTTVSAVSEEDAAAAVPGKEPASVDRNDMKKFLEIMEKMDVDQILNNTRLMKANVKCFMNEGPCTAQLNEMKSKRSLDHARFSHRARSGIYLRAKTWLVF